MNDARTTITINPTNKERATAENLVNGWHAGLRSEAQAALSRHDLRALMDCIAFRLRTVRIARARLNVIGEELQTRLDELLP